MIDVSEYVSALVLTALAIMFILCYITVAIIIYHDLHESERGENGDKNKNYRRR